jgi:hypothetical protein
MSRRRRYFFLKIKKMDLWIKILLNKEENIALIKGYIVCKCK